MERIRYIQAADLHLDTPFCGLSRSGLPSAELRDATFGALENLAQVCEQEEPDFLLLAGDIYNQEERSVRAQLALRDLCERLAGRNIRVFIVHGNHDPLKSRLAAIEWPENTVIFGPEPDTARVVKDGSVAAIVHGISHATDREGRNLAQLFSRVAGEDCFQVGLLHCNVDGAVASDRYAPCSLADLLATGLDAWALGHAHAGKILSQQPFIAYSGNTQGLNPNESGPKGCYLVDARREDGVWICESRFIELDQVRWQESGIDLDDVTTLEGLLDALRECLDEAASSGQNTILTINLTGSTTLDAELRKPDALADLQRELADYRDRRPAVWIRRINLRTTPHLSEAELLDRDDLLGETVRLAKKLRDDPDALGALAQAAFSPLYGARRSAPLPEAADTQDLKEILARALALCQDALERR